MITQEAYDNGLRCRGAGFNCNNCTTRHGCVQYKTPSKEVKIKDKVYKIKDEPKGVSMIVTNDKMSFFRAFRGQRLGPNSKKYIAYIHEIVED